MINTILKFSINTSKYNIEKEKQIYQDLGGIIPEFFDSVNELNKQEVIKVLKDHRTTNKVQFLTILFWGICFEVLRKGNAKKLIHFIENKNFEENFEAIKSKIINADSPRELFAEFSNKNKYKIPGVSYAYFTKLFFFYRVSEGKKIYPILDKWLSFAWCAIDGDSGRNPTVYEEFYKSTNKPNLDVRLMRKPAIAYEKYVEFMHKLSIQMNVDIITLEEKLFGVNLKEYSTSDNPRILYKNWALKNNIALIKPKTLITSKKRATKQSDKKENLYEFRDSTQYTGIYIKGSSTKIGYIDSSGWLSASMDLKNIFKESNLKWEKGNTRGGSKEKYKVKFDSKQECLSLIKEKLKI